MINKSEFINPIVINNSPIEFLIIGSLNGRDRVIVKSNNAGLDLLGVSVKYPNDFSYIDMPLSSLTLGRSRQLNVISSHPIADFNPKSDKRQSEMKFAWVGNCTSFRKKEIQALFEQSLSDLRYAFIDLDETSIEWSIAPLIFQCTKENERHLRMRRFFYMTLAIYGIAGLFAFGYLITRNILL